jgi:hypothetical protein
MINVALLNIYRSLDGLPHMKVNLGYMARLLVLMFFCFCVLLICYGITTKRGLLEIDAQTLALIFYMLSMNLNEFAILLLISFNLF